MFKSYKSPNYGERERGAKPSMIVLHYTGMATAREALERLCNPETQVSAHYFIDEDGKVKQLVADKYRAWHAGKSSWRGEADINSHSIGIEIVNPGHEFGYREFPAKQIAALEKLCKKLMKKYDIPAARVLGHSDVSPTRKEDPGELFPWQALAAEGIGVWPEVTDADRNAAKNLLSDQLALHKKLIQLGYDSAAPFEKVITAFHRHFYPEIFLRGNPARIESESIARLNALLR